MAPNTRIGENVNDRALTRHRPHSPDSGSGGFTLLELLIVVALIGILTALAVPTFRQTPTKAKEAVLKEDLYTLRDVIDQYFSDKGKYPATLETLVEDGYLRKIPVDPFTESSDTWQIEMADSGEEGSEEAGGVYDVHSGSTSTALDGTTYSEW
jgi:general secretion pathway protein G